MLSPKRTLLLLITGAAFALISFEIASPPPPGGGDPPSNPSSYERFPPVATNYWVQKLATPLGDGSNMIMRIKYISDTVLPPAITVYISGGTINFHDDGIAEDPVSGDGIYSAYITEDIPSFLTQVASLEANLTAQGTFTTFNGHFAEEHTSFVAFDLTNFKSNHEVPLASTIVSGADCGTALLPQNSLFITDLSVVEDGARTYNVAVDTGNPVGVWTFGSMIRNIVNDNTPGACRQFLKSWVKSYNDGRNINGQAVGIRTDVVKFLIIPWLQKANGSTSIGISVNTWEAIWDTTNETALVQNAPFKLMAIVNRLDLMGNHSYYGSIALAGETRFIYTLIAPVDISTGGFGTAIIHKGEVPIQVGNGGNVGNDDTTLIDWKGMNVILEYGNVQTAPCDLQSFAQQWLDLSTDTLGTPTFNSDLEAITNQVTRAGAAPTKPNGSAIDRIRSNERIFFQSRGTTINPVFVSQWSASDWQLSQFELDPNTTITGAHAHPLMPVPVANTPQLDANNQTHMLMSNVPFLGVYPISTVMSPSSSAALIDWVYANKVAVSHGSHVLPASYIVPGTTDTFLLAATADVHNEQGHFWDLNWGATGLPHYSVAPVTDTMARLLRRQLSINTCQGCHSGENKTMFTQVRPVGYGVPINYWSASAPGSETGNVDLRFVQNTGTSFKNGTTEPVYDLLFNTPLYTNTITTITVPYVSAFLTGRAYHGGSDYSDDNTANVIDNGTDNSLSGYYYVYDPADSADFSGDYTRPNPDQFTAYNDLMMRKNALCQFLNLFACSGGHVVISIISSTKQIPYSE